MIRVKYMLSLVVILLCTSCDLYESVLLTNNTESTISVYYCDMILGEINHNIDCYLEKYDYPLPNVKPNETYDIISWGRNSISRHKLNGNTRFVVFIIDSNSYSQYLKYKKEDPDFSFKENVKILHRYILAYEDLKEVGFSLVFTQDMIDHKD